MKLFILLVMISFSTYAYASESNSEALVGEWEQFDSGWEVKYTYFRFEADHSGVFATVRGEGGPHIDNFKGNQVNKIDENIYEILFDEGRPDHRARLLLSAYRKDLNENSGLATGMLYMYIKEDEKWKLFNTIFVRLSRITDRSFVDKVGKLLRDMN